MVKVFKEHVRLSRGKLEVDVVVRRPEGQYRGTLEFDHEPTKKELKEAAKAWLATVKFREPEEIEV